MLFSMKTNSSKFVMASRTQWVFRQMLLVFTIYKIQSCHACWEAKVVTTTLMLYGTRILNGNLEVVMASSGIGTPQDSSHKTNQSGYLNHLALYYKTGIDVNFSYNIHVSRDQP